MRATFITAMAFALALGGALPAPAYSADEETPITAQQAQDFERWKWAFRSEALAAGIAPQVFDNAFAGVTLNPKVIRLDGRQPEFSRPIWKYLESAVSATRSPTGAKSWRRTAS